MMMKQTLESAGYRKAIVWGKRIMILGLLLVFLSMVVGNLADMDLAFYILAVTGAVLMLAGWLLVFKKGVCPKCGKYLGTNFPRLPDGVPNRCPHCGEKL